MNQTPASVRAFTLIEMMIAVALGTLLIYTSFAGFRAASQTITVANRLSQENALMRAGVQRAHDEIDFWMDLDNPLLPDGQRQLKNRNGLPFSPFSVTFPGSAASVSTSVTAAPEAANGWDPSDTAWAAANPRSWLRGNLAEKSNTDLRFGRYGVVANLKDRLTSAELASFAENPPPSAPMPPATKIFGDVDVPFHWYYRQVSGLTKALGYYGLFEYLPANAMYVFYGPTNNDSTNYTWDETKTNLGGIALWCIKPGDWGFNNGDGGQQTSRGKYRNSYMSSYAILHPSMASAPYNLDLWVEHRRWWGLGYNNDANAHREFNTRTMRQNFLLPSDPQLPYLGELKPDAWPSVTVSVQRFIKNARHATICRVHMVHPLTGSDIELSFSGFGTSLRGARQQRLPGTGWTKWDNDSDHSNDSAYKHLDSY